MGGRGLECDRSRRKIWIGVNYVAALSHFFWKSILFFLFRFKQMAALNNPQNSKPYSDIFAFH